MLSGLSDHLVMVLLHHDQLRCSGLETLLSLNVWPQFPASAPNCLQISQDSPTGEFAARNSAANWLRFDNVSSAIVLNLCSGGYCFAGVRALSFKQG